MTKQTKWNIVINEINKVCSESQVQMHSKMDGERSIILNCAIITALLIPCAVISVVTAVICVVITLLCVVKKLCARVQRELDLFNEIYGENRRPVWDEGGLFAAFIKGEDVHDRRQKTKNLRPKTENRKKATTTTRNCSENGTTSTAKRPLIGNFFLRNLIRQRLYTSLQISSGITGKRPLTSIDYKNYDNTKIDASVYPVTNGNAKGDDQLQAANRSRDHSYPLHATRQVSSQAANVSLEENLHEGTSVPSSQVTVLPQNSADKTGNVNIHQESGRSSLRVEKRKKRSKAASVGCITKVGGDHTKKLSSQESESASFKVNKEKNSTKTDNVGCSHYIGVGKKAVDNQEIKRSSAVTKRKKRSKPASITCSNQINVDKDAASQEIKHSSFDVNNGQKRSKALIFGYSNEVSADKKTEAPQEIGRSSSAKKGKKRGKPASVGCSNQISVSEFQAKKPRKEPVAVQHRRETSVLIRLRKITKERASQNGPHSRTRTILRQRKLNGVKLRHNARFVGQPELFKVANQEPEKEIAIPFEGLLNENLPLQFPGKESTTRQNVIGEVMDAKRPLPVTPFTAEQAAESMETDQELLQTTPSMTELVSLMEQLTISLPEDEDYDVPLVSDSDSYVESDAEYDLFPELQSLPEQVLQLIQLLA